MIKIFLKIILILLLSKVNLQAKSEFYQKGIDLFNKNLGRIQENYATEEGVSKKFFEYKSSFDYKMKDIDKTGLSYSAFVTIFMEDDNYDTEYIVTEKFLTSSLKDKCNLDLVETASFFDIYKQKKKFFEDVAPKEENIESKNYFMKISQFYDENDSVNKASLEFCKLHKYYVFKKRALDKSESVKVNKVKKGGNVKKLKVSVKKNNLIDKYLNSGSTLDM